MRNVSDKSYRENQNTHFMFSNLFENCAIYEIMWKNIVVLERTQLSDVHFTLRAGDYKRTLSEYITLIVFISQQWLH
jgi:hypothetical protein